MNTIDPQLIGALIGALICGFISAAIASSKNRSAGGGFVTGFFLGPIGIIVTLCKRKQIAAESYSRQTGYTSSGYSQGTIISKPVEVRKRSGNIMSGFLGLGISAGFGFVGCYLAPIAKGDGLLSLGVIGCFCIAIFLVVVSIKEMCS